MLLHHLPDTMLPLSAVCTYGQQQLKLITHRTAPASLQQARHLVLLLSLTYDRNVGRVGSPPREKAWVSELKLVLRLSLRPYCLY